MLQKSHIFADIQRWHHLYRFYKGILKKVFHVDIQYNGYRIELKTPLR